MGFRLYIEDDLNENCLGKLFSYTSEHLQSMQYLIDIGALDWLIEDVRGDLTLYDKAEIEFDAAYQVKIDLRQREFRTFLLLYITERFHYYCSSDMPVSEVFKLYSDFIDRFGNEETVTLIWM